MLDTVAWVLIFAGAAVGLLGWFLARADSLLGGIFMAAGAADVAVGIGLIVWRSRLTDNEEQR